MTNLLSYALTNLADVKESLGIDSSVTKYDNLIRRMINKSTDMIENYCERRFTSTVYTAETYNASHTNTLVLKQRPIITFTSLEVRDWDLNQGTFETIPSELYFVDSSSGILQLLWNAYGSFKRYQVTYTAGYATIPSDLAEACVALACYYYKNADSNIQIRERQEGMRMEMYYPGITNFSGLIQMLGLDSVLDTYKNITLTDNL